MKLSELKSLLPTIDSLNFALPDGTFVPAHFHVTEVGLITKNFIDCGGALRQETSVNLQLWEANDLDHRLKAQKLLHIIASSEKVLEIADAAIEVEYQTGTIGKYDLAFNGTHFELRNKHAACLASDKCGLIASPQAERSATPDEACCAPGGNCC